VSDHAANLILRDGHNVTVPQRAELIQSFFRRFSYFSASLAVTRSSNFSLSSNNDDTSAEAQAM
jgi:hypothetical protein